MTALLLSLAVFVFWCLLGWAAVSALDSRRHLLRNLLLAPAIGAAVAVLPVFWLNRAGLPVRYAGPIASLLLFAAALYILFRVRPLTPLRRWLPFSAIFLLALLLAGHPFLRFGLHWISYGNDDMANYVLAAHRFHDYGYFAVPDDDAFLRNRDTTLYYWFMHGVVGVRPGSELLLAWLMSLTRLSGLQAFMPLLLALHLAVISAAAALVCRTAGGRRAALLTALLVALSALTTLGFVYQLLGQEFGLALLAAAAACLLPPYPSLSRPRRWRYGLLAALLVSTLLIVYPEVVPFLILAFALSTAVLLQRRRLPMRQLLSTLVPIGLICLLVLNRFLLTALVFLLKAARRIQVVDLQYSLFPFYLLPSGLANLWGFMPLNDYYSEPWLSLSIAAGALLLLLTALAAVWLAWQGHPVGSITVVLLAMALFLFVRQSDFGLFKLAMYLQPFALGALATAWLRLLRRA